MAVDIRAMIEEKNKDKSNNKKLILKDVNHDLIIALLALPVYGKDVRNEEILSIIVNDDIGKMKKLKKQIKEEYEASMKGKKLKKTKQGYMIDSGGRVVLTPKF